MKKNILFFAFVLFAVSIFGQAPQGFNYQAVARDSQGDPIKNKILAIKITIYSYSTAVWTEVHSKATNTQGLFSLVLGDPEATGSGTAGSFDQIDWGTGSYSMGVEADDGSGYKDMGTTPFQSVPYALYAANGGGGGNGGWETDQDTISAFSFVGIGTSNPSASALTVQGFSDQPEVPLFEVKREDGVPVFAVFNDGVIVYVDEDRKGVKGGFAVGGYNTANKGVGQEYMRVTPDSVRIYVPEEGKVKGVKGGFAVGGYNTAGKGIAQDLLFVTPDSIRLYVPNKENDPGVSGLQGGFAVETFDPDAVEDKPREYIMGMNRGITRFNTADNSKGFSIGSQGEGWSSTYMQVTPVNTFVGFESGMHTKNDPDAWFSGQGSMNVFLGYKSGWNNEFGHHNVFLGQQSGLKMVGDSLDDIQGSYNVLVGDNSGKLLTDGWSNVFLGENTGRDGSSSYGNIFIGSHSGIYANGASGNIAIGQHAGQYLTKSDNVIIGQYSGSNNTDGTGNVFLGAYAGANSYGSSNIFIGSNAGSGEEGSNKLYIDNTNSSTPLIWGDFSTDLLRMNAEVGINTIPGGNRLRVEETRDTHYGAAIVGNNYTNAGIGTGVEGSGGWTGLLGFAFGSGTGERNGVYGSASGGATNYGVVGYASGTEAYGVYAGGDFAYTGSIVAASDKKFKEDIQTITPVMQNLMKVKPRSYNIIDSEEAKSFGLQSKSQYGFVAQEIEEIFPELVVEVHHPSMKEQGKQGLARKQQDTYKGVKYMEMIPLLLKGMQEQQAEIEALKAEIELLKGR